MIDAVKDKARGHWREILVALGIDPKHLGTNKPCPVCHGEDRFSFADKDGSGKFFCRSHGHGDGFDLLTQLNGWDLKRAVREVERVLGVPEKVRFERRPDPARALNAVYRGSRPVEADDQVHHYLLARGLSVLPPALRFHPSLPVAGTRYPAMLALLHDVTGRAVSLHRTFLDGANKAPVDAPKMLMTPTTTVTGACVRLWPVTDIVGLAEGIETSLAVYELFGVSTWACVSAHGLETIQLPEQIQTVHIYADHDLHHVGARAAYIAAERLSREGRKVTVKIAPVPGMDFVDELNLVRGQVAA